MVSSAFGWSVSGIAEAAAVASAWANIRLFARVSCVLPVVYFEKLIKLSQRFGDAAVIMEDAAWRGE